ncbi:MAG: hypothetical protein JRN08_07205 [Nitrososphaerota archaeon]|nr:hypothetical protein [Nitrososphaerota archaeon]
MPSLRSRRGADSSPRTCQVRTDLRARTDRTLPRRGAAGESRLSLGRYGADDPAAKKIPLHVTVDKKVGDALGKIRSKKSVSELVNGLLTTVVRQFDPGPAAPVVYKLVEVLAEFEAKARDSGDGQTLAAVALLRSELEPYIDLAQPDPEPGAPTLEPRPDAVEPPKEPGQPLSIEQRLHIPPTPVRATKRDYYWYAVPVLCHEKPMVYLRDAKAWKCFICGKLIHDV